MGLVNSKFETVKKRISNNDKFFAILESISMNMDDISFRQKNCYLGHMKKLANYFHRDLLKNETDERWLGFRDRFLKIENEKENKALGNVYVNNDDDENDLEFHFNAEEIKKKYSKFLGFDVEEETEKAENDDEEKNEEESANPENMENSPEKETPQEIEKEENETEEETKDSESKYNFPDLKIQEEIMKEEGNNTTYSNNSFWKPNMNYKLDDLLSDLQ